MNRSRSIFNSINEVKAWMSTKAKVPNHYETLNVTQDCTQDDIKAAYYKLSKQYHPDKNASADAKRKFQNVSDAYEVLGNFNKRKQYDRNLMARGQNASIRQVTYTVSEDPLAGFYKSRMSSYNPVNTGSGASSQFDFDEWTRAHYGRSLQRTIKDRGNRIIRKKLQLEHEKLKEREKASATLIIIASMIVFTALMVQNYFLTTFDKKLTPNNIPKKKES